MIERLRSPAIQLVVLPLIPVGLLLTHCVRWEKNCATYLFRRISRFRYQQQHRPAIVGSSATSPSVTLCSALAFPLFANAFGRLLQLAAPLFGSDALSTLPRWKRSICGGVIYVAVKSILKIYYHYVQLSRSVRRRIVDFSVVNVASQTSMDSTRASTNSDDEVAEDNGNEDENNAAFDGE